jgi:hypothetical protein
MENIAMDRACLGFMPILLAKNHNKQEINKSAKNFNEVLFIMPCILIITVLYNESILCVASVSKIKLQLEMLLEYHLIGME